MNDTLIQLVYVSKPSRDISFAEIRELLIKARVNNHFRDVTGVLLYDGASFLQVLEGPEETVKKLYDSIAKDPRHAQVTALFEREVDHRDFGDWAMGLGQIAGDHMDCLPGLKKIDTARKTLMNSSAAEDMVSAIKSAEFHDLMSA